MTARVEATVDSPPVGLSPRRRGAAISSVQASRKQAGRDDVTFQGFELYALRHTCLTRWRRMDSWTLAYLAGHGDMNITKRHVHPQEQTIRAAMDRAREVEGGHTFGHTARPAEPEKTAPAFELINSEKGFGAPGGTRTPGLLVRSQPLYPAELRAHGDSVASGGAVLERTSARVADLRDTATRRPL